MALQDTNILVCLKAVPDPSADIKISEDRLSLELHSSAPYGLSSLDEQALEEALTIKDSCKNVLVHVFSIGAEERALNVLRRALGMGADKAILCSTPTSYFMDDPLAVASAIASWAKMQPYSLYMLGASSDDLMQGQVGSILAELLGLPRTTCVVSTKLTTNETVLVDREIQAGLRLRLEMDLPGVVTILSSKRTPRYPSLSNMLRAKRIEPERFICQPELLLKNEHVKTSYYYPPRQRTCTFLSGEVGLQAGQLLDVLRSKGIL